MFIHKIILTILAVQTISTNEYVNSIVPNSSSGDILFIQSVLNGVQFSYYQKVKNKKSILEYKQVIDPQPIVCNPKTLKVYRYEEGNIQFSQIHTYTFTDNIFEKLIDIGQNDPKVSVSASSSCEVDELKIYLYYPKKKMQNVAIKMEKNEDFYQLNIMEQIDNQSKLKTILQEANQTMDQIEEFELLYVYKFKYSQSRSYNIQFQLTDDKTFENKELVVPRQKYSITDYLVYNNKIQVLYLAIEDYYNAQNPKPSSNDFSKDETFKNSVLFQYSLNIDQEGIKVGVQSIEIGQDKMFQKNYFINCQSNQKTINQINQSEIKVVYELKQSNGTQTYTNQALKSKKGQYIQDFQYVFSDIPYDKSSTQCQINVVDDENEQMVITVQMIQNSKKFKNYSIIQDTSNQSLSEIEQEVEFDETLNAKLKEEYFKAPHLQINEDELYLHANGQEIKCDKVFGQDQIQLSDSFTTLQIHNFMNELSYYGQKLQWISTTEDKLISHLYQHKFQTYLIWNQENIQNCKFVSTSNDILQIAISSGDKPLVQYKTSISSENVYQVDAYNEANQVIQTCSTKLESKLPSQYKLYFQYTKSKSFPKYFKFYGSGKEENQIEIFEEDYFDITNNKNCFIDDAVLDEFKYLEVVFYDKPIEENDSMHYVKSYFLKNEIKIFQMKQNQQNMKADVESIQKSSYARKNKVWLIRNFEENNQLPQQWEQFKHTSTDYIPNDQNIMNYQVLIYFSNEVKDPDQTYETSFYQKDQEESLYFLIALKKSNQLQLGTNKQNKKSGFKYWIVLVFVRNDYSRMQLTAYDLYNSSGSSLFKDESFEYGQSFGMTDGALYFFEIKNQLNVNLMNQEIIKQVSFNQPVVILLQPMVSQNVLNIKFGKGVIDNDNAKIQVVLSMRESHII